MLIARSIPLATRSSEALASYFPNRSCIRLSPTASVVDKNGKRRDDVPLDQYSIFIHEYVHYFHNFSTVAGAMGYILYCNLLALFSAVLDSSGHSRGQSMMEPLDKERYTDCLDYLKHMEGDSSPDPIANKDVVSINVVDVEEETWTGRFRGEQIQRAKITLRCQATLKDSTVQHCRFALGTLAILEGIAYELDRLVSLGPDGLGNGEDNAPSFPYLVLRSLGLYHLGDIDRICLLACAVTALNTVDPARALLDCLADYSQRRIAKESATDAVAAVLKATEPHRNAAIKTLVEHDLPEITAMFEGRSTAEFAARSTVEIFRDLFGQRISSPLLELAPFAANKVDVSALNGFVHGVLPCDVIQERSGNRDTPQRDLLLSFHRSPSDGICIRTTDVLRPLHAQLDFFIAHAGETGFLESALVARECPFYTCCTLDYRVQHQDVCKTRPWDTFSLSQKETCWFGLAVANTLGTVVLESDVERIRTRSYFHWLNKTGRQWQDPVANWLQAEEEERVLAFRGRIDD
jgi:hypothetical protein